MTHEKRVPWYKQEKFLAAAFLLFISYFTVVHNFWNPPSLFWDENYHIASAQKYLNGVYFMEPHPPLGKLLIALGEKIAHVNAADNQFIDTDYARNPPAGFSFFGYRLFPVLLAWFTVPVIFAIFLLITESVTWATLLSFLYVFDNAILVHARSAMLESTLLFFACLTILAFLLACSEKYRDKMRWIGLFFGLAFGAVMATKVNGLILILLLPALLVRFWPDWRKMLQFIIPGLIGFAVVYLSVWQIHFAVGGRIISTLPDDGYYQASKEYKQILIDHRNGSLGAFPVELRDSLAFVGHYEAGVPRLDLAKPDENGSPAFMWPIGARTINYRWETPEGYNYKYLYLVANPVVWGVGLLGIILSVSLIVAATMLPLEKQLSKKSLFLLCTFLAIYGSYMIVMNRLERVMYLYHYFVPLLISFFLFAVCFVELRRLFAWHLTAERRTGVLMVLGTAIFLAFELFHPFTYYEPITDKEFATRNWVKLWDLRCVHCERDNPLVVPRN